MNFFKENWLLIFISCLMYLNIFGFFYKLYQKNQVKKYGVSKHKLNSTLSSSILYEYSLVDSRCYSFYQWNDKAFKIWLITNIDKIILQFEKSAKQPLSDVHKYYLIEFIFKNKIEYSLRDNFCDYWHGKIASPIYSNKAIDYINLPLKIVCDLSYSKQYQKFLDKKNKKF